ncbi:hypothetical protein GCM10027278_15910 [Paralcaligenes ginsengisoli]
MFGPGTNESKCNLICRKPRLSLGFYKYFKNKSSQYEYLGVHGDENNDPPLGFFSNKIKIRNPNKRKPL